LGKFNDNTLKSKFFYFKNFILDLNENNSLINKKDQIQLRMFKSNSEKIEFYYDIYRKILFSGDFYKKSYAVLNIPYTIYLKILVKEEENIWKFVFANIGLSLVCLLFKK